MAKGVSAPPVIIIGAGRSGTNMLRDLLVQMPGFGTWPCDEINYIWRHGNAQYPTDEFVADMATEPVRNFIHRAFDNIAKKQGSEQVVEKTCANSLRVRFVAQIYPDVRYVYIVRDGRDVVASAMKRWTAPLYLPYIFRKARYIPSSDVPYYAFRYFLNRIHRFSSGEKRLASWGPRFEGMEDALRSMSLAEVCALQWRRCSERSEEDFAKVSSANVYRLQYEAFVQDPVAGIGDLAEFLEAQLSSIEVRDMAQSVSAKSVGKWRQEISIEDQERIKPLLEPMLGYFEYV